MKNNHKFLIYILLICVFSLFFVIGSAFGDNSKEYSELIGEESEWVMSGKGEHEYEIENEREDYETNETYEELGSLAGWLTVGFLAFAIAPFSLKKIKPFSNSKALTSLTKGIKQNHYVIGILTVIMALIHGTLMLYSEGNNTSVWLGIMAGTVMVFVAAVGAIIKLRKKYSKLSLNIHRVPLVLLIIFFGIHVFE